VESVTTSGNPIDCDTGIGFPVHPFASDGVYTNRVKISWDNLAAKADEIKVYRDGDEIGVVSSNAKTMYDYDAIPGKIHKYGIAAVKNAQEFLPVPEYGFIAPDGRIEGKVTTPTLAAIEGVEVSVAPIYDTLRRSLSFDADDDNVTSIRNAPIGNTGSMTIEFWIKKNISPGTTDFIFDKRNGSNGFRGYAIDKAMYLNFNGGTFITGNNFFDGTWQHIAITLDNTNLWVLRNGVMYNQLAGGWTWSDIVDPLIIGNQRGSTTAALNGNLDDFRIWNHVRTDSAIQADLNRELSGNESGLLVYYPFNLNSSQTNITGDMAQNAGFHGMVYQAVPSTDAPEIRSKSWTNIDGFYSISRIYYDQATQFTIEPYKLKHGFKPAYKERKLEIPSPTAQNIDFIDTTAFSIEGFVAFPQLPGQTLDTCKAAGVEILVNGVFRGIKTDVNGRFNLSVPEEGNYTFTPRFENHTFSPTSITLNITDHVEGVNALHFQDTKTHMLTVRARGGSRSCDIPIGKADISLDAFGMDDNTGTPCHTFNNVSSIDGNFVIALPAQRYRITVKYQYAGFGDPNGEEIRTIDFRTDSVIARINEGVVPPDTLWKNVEDTLYFNYHSQPVLTIDPFWEELCSLRVLDQYTKYQIRMNIVENYIDISSTHVECPLDTGYVLIYNDLRDGFTGIPDTVTVSHGQIFSDYSTYTNHYDFFAGEPNIYASGIHDSLSYKKDFYVALKAYNSPVVTSPHFWSLIRGQKSRTQTFFTKTPELPLLILRDPPGDQSFSFIEKGTTFSQTYSTSYEWGGGAGVFIDGKVGAGTTVPFVGKIGVDIHATAKFQAGRVNHDQTTVTTGWTATETWSTADEIPGVSSRNPGQGDVVMGASINMVYALTDVVDLDQNTCTIVRDTSLAWGSEGFNTTYTYTEDHIRNTLIPQLTTLKNILASNPAQSSQDSSKIFQNYIDVWEQVIEKNDSLKRVAEKKKNVSFSAGGIYSSSYTTTSDSTVSFDYTIYIDTEVSLAIGAHAGDFNMVEGGVAANFRWTTGKTFDTTYTTNQTVGYSLNDDDPGDFFSVDIKEDPVYKTPVFKTVAGTSSCPWEGGTQSRDGAFFPGSTFPKPILGANEYLQADILPTEPGVFILSLTNTSESGEARYYDLYVDQVTNLDGAIIRVGGVVIEDKIVFYLPPGVTKKATMTIERGPVAYDYDNIGIVLTASCDYWLYDEKYFSVHFLTPCSNATIVDPGDNWLVNQTNNNVMHIVMTDLEKDKIGEDLELQYRKIGTQKWNLGMLIPKNDIVDQKFKFFETDWAIPLSVTDGLYEIRVKIRCTAVLGGGITYSNVVTGIINRTSLQVFGTPEPKDGILNFGDEISVTFTTDIDCGAIKAGNITLMYFDDSTFIPSNQILVDCRGNKLIITPLIPLVQIQNRTLVASVDNIYNFNGNRIDSAIVWSFKVNQNPLIWETANTSATVYQGTAMSVSGKLRNVGGKMQSFTLSNTKNWLTPFTTNGTLPPAGVQVMNFTVSDKLNPGVYRDTVYAQTTDGDEPFYIEVTVLHSPPSWTINPKLFQYTMDMTAQFVTDTSNTLSTDVNDIVAAFVGNECRGVTNIQFVPSMNVFRSFLTVYSDARSPETVSFRAWDASTGTIYTMQETVSFDKVASYGTLISPYILHPTGVVQYIPFESGWNWFSLNTRSQNMSPNALLSSITPGVNDILKSQTTYTQYVSGTGWVGSLDSLRIGQAYKIQLTAPSTLSFTGISVPVTTPIPVSSGWNWIGYLPVKNIPVNTALVSLIASEGDRIQSKIGFSQYSPSGLWQGSLSVLGTNQGYVLKSATAGSLVYPDIQGIWNRRDKTPGIIADGRTFVADASIDWKVNPKSYENSMNVTASLVIDGRHSNSMNNIVGAFVNDECRGVATPISVGSEQVYFLTVYANITNEVVTFRAYDADTDSILNIDEKITFAADAVFGNPSAPYALHARSVILDVETDPSIPKTYTLDQNYPNPFNPNTTIMFALPKSGDVQLMLYDMLGNEVVTLVKGYKDAGTYRVQLQGAHLRSGQYTYQLRSGGFVASRQMMLIK